MIQQNNSDILTTIGFIKNMKINGPIVDRVWVFFWTFFWLIHLSMCGFSALIVTGYDELVFNPDVVF